MTVMSNTKWNRQNMTLTSLTGNQYKTISKPDNEPTTKSCFQPVNIKSMD
jgi:hypothetical protein